MTAQILKFRRKKPDREVRAELPHGLIFKAREADLGGLFEVPEKLDRATQNGLIRLALAIVYADHRKRRTI